MSWLSLKTCSKKMDKKVILTRTLDRLDTPVGNSSESWFCTSCVPRFNDSLIKLLNASSDSESSEPLLSNNHDDVDLDPNTTAHKDFNAHDKIKSLRKSNFGRCIIGYLNINSIRNKIYSFSELVTPCNFDIFGLGETKINQSFPNAQFALDGYRLFRRDCYCFGGGLMTFIRNDFPCRRLNHLETVTVETIVMEIIIAKAKWCLIFGYNPPKTVHSVFSDEMNHLLTSVTGQYDNYAIIGDLNFNVLSSVSSSDKSNSDICPLLNLCNDFNLKNLIRQPTFYHHRGKSLIDVFITNQFRKFLTSGVIDMNLVMVTQ